MEVEHFTKGKMGVGRGAEREAPYRQRKMHQSLQKRQVGKRCNQLSPLRFFPDMPFICVAQHCVHGGLYTLTNSGCYLKSIYSSRKVISHLISYSNEMGKLISCFSEVCACWADGTAAAQAKMSPGLSSPTPPLGWVISRISALFKEQLQAFPKKCTAMENTLSFQLLFSKLDSSRC